MNFNGYTNIPDWMLALELDVYETIILAVIYGFSQDGESTYKGTQQYLADKAKCSKRKVATALTNLVEMKLIQKIDVDIRGIHLCEYRVTDTCTMCKGIAPYATGGVAPDAGGVAPHATNNINNINISPLEINNNKGKRFDFKQALIDMGVNREVAEDWMLVRKSAKATNTETAFHRIKHEIEKSGLSANECITIAVSRSWRGFQADWVFNQRQRQTGRVSVLDNNKMVAQELMRMAGMEDGI